MKNALLKREFNKTTVNAKFKKKNNFQKKNLKISKE